MLGALIFRACRGELLMFNQICCAPRGGSVAPPKGRAIV